jgi:hypothetical protein
MHSPWAGETRGEAQGASRISGRTRRGPNRATGGARLALADADEARDDVRSRAQPSVGAALLSAGPTSRGPLVHRRILCTGAHRGPPGSVGRRRRVRRQADPASTPESIQDRKAVKAAVETSGSYRTSTTPVDVLRPLDTERRRVWDPIGRRRHGRLGGDRGTSSGIPARAAAARRTFLGTFEAGITLACLKWLEWHQCRSRWTRGSSAPAS